MQSWVLHSSPHNIPVEVQNAFSWPSLFFHLFTGPTSFSPSHPPPTSLIFAYSCHSFHIYCPSLHVLLLLSNPNPSTALLKKIHIKENTRSFAQVAASWQKGFEVITNRNEGPSDKHVHGKYRVYVQFLQSHLQTKVIFINPLFLIQSDQNYEKPLDWIEMSYCIMNPVRGADLDSAQNSSRSSDLWDRHR